jgi:hypothetical protein
MLWPLTPCMPCSFGLLPHPRSGSGVQPSGLLRGTLTGRWIPLVPAVYCMRVARPVRKRMLAVGGDGSSSAESEASPGWPLSCGQQPEGSRKPGGRPDL